MARARRVARRPAVCRGARRPAIATVVKVVEVINVDFSLRHFVLPLMRAARDAGHEVIGACAEGPLLAPARVEGFRVVALPPMRSLSPVAAWRAGVPRIAYTCHGFLFNQPGPWPRRFASFAMEFLAGRVTTTFLTVSAEEARDASRLHIAGAPIAVLNGRDPARFHPDATAREHIRAALGVASDRVVVIAVSRLVRHKGLIELAHALRDIDAELWVVGDRLPSDRGPDIAAALRAAGLGERLRLLGYREDVPALLAAAEIFALPSHFEGLPMSVIEAMLTALPVVATDIRGPREQIVDNETGLLVPPATVPPLAIALSRLATDPALRTRMGEAGRRRALDLYDESAVLARTLDALGLSAHPPPP